MIVVDVQNGNSFGVSGSGRKRREKVGEGNEKWFKFHDNDLKD